MQRAELLAFLRRQVHAVEATVGAEARPQAAVIGIAVSDRFEIVFDTLASTRKWQNLRQNPHVALVVWEGERTAQIEGVADAPAGDELARLQAVYFERFPDGPARMAWPGITYVRVRPTWIRFTDFGGGEPRVVELDAAALA